MMNGKKRTTKRFVFVAGIKTAENISHSRSDIGLLETIKIKLWSGATSLFDVQRWTFDV
jgi:hypothetical protein